MTFAIVQERESLHTLVSRYGLRDKNLYECVNHLVPTLMNDRIKKVGRVLAISFTLYRSSKAAQQRVGQLLSHTWGIDKKIFRQFLHRRQLQFLSPAGKGGAWRHVTHRNGKAIRIAWHELCQLPVRVIYRRAILPLLYMLLHPLLQQQYHDKRLQFLLQPATWQIVRADDERKRDMLHFYLALPTISNSQAVTTDRAIAALSNQRCHTNSRNYGGTKMQWTKQQRSSFALVSSFHPWTSVLRSADRAEAAFPELRGLAAAQSRARDEANWVHEYESRASSISSFGVRLHLQPHVPTSRVLQAVAGSSYLSVLEALAWTRRFRSTAQFFFLQHAMHQHATVVQGKMRERANMGLRRRPGDRSHAVYLSRCSGSSAALLLVLRITTRKK